MFCLAVLITVIVIYAPGFSGEFVLDDSDNIVNNPHIQFDEPTFENFKKGSLSSSSGTFGRPISMFTIAVNRYISGLEPFSYKLTNALIHALTGWMIYIFLTLLLHLVKTRGPQCNLTHSKWLPAAIAFIWVIHPIQLTTILYIVQRMTSLAALFTFASLSFYLVARERMLGGGPHAPRFILLSIVSAGLGFLCKETAILVVVYAALIEVIFLKFATGTNRGTWIFRRLAVTSLVMGGLAVVIFLISHSAWISDAYRIREFTLGERLMTQLRVLWFYVHLIVLPDLTTFALHHDDFVVSRNWFHPYSTLLAALGWGAWVVAGLWFRKTYPLLSFAMFWFLAGHVLESSFLPLEMVHEHRNYVPSLGVLMAVVPVGLAVLGKLSLKFLSTSLKVGVVLALAFLTAMRADIWGDPYVHAFAEASHHPNSGRANIRAGQLSYELAQKYNDKNRAVAAVSYFEKAKIADPGDITSHTSLLQIDLLTFGAYFNATWNELKDVLAYGVPRQSNPVLIATLVECAKNMECNISGTAIVDLLKAALSNTRLSIRARGRYEAALAAYLGNNAGDIGQAESYARLALSHEPSDFTNRSNLVRLVAMQGRIDEARELLRENEAVDKSGLYREITRRDAAFIEQFAARMR